MVINHNMTSINSSRTLKNRTGSIASVIEKLSSGERINKAGDDASGLSVSEKMRTQIAGLKQASNNAANAISFIQTTEGYLSETSEILRRIRELAIQSANGIYSSDDRLMIQVEVSQMVMEVDRIASHAEFNSMKMLTGKFAAPAAENRPAASMWFHVGANQGQRIAAYIGTMTAGGLGMRAESISISTPDKADRSIAIIDEAIKKVSKQRSDLGAYQNRLEKLVKGIDVAAENMQAAESQIRDANIAEEMVNYARDSILTQANIAMLAQANAKNQAVLRLLG